MRNIIILSLAMALLGVGLCTAQGWERTYGEVGQNEATSRTRSRYIAVLNKSNPYIL